MNITIAGNPKWSSRLLPSLPISAADFADGRRSVRNSRPWLAGRLALHLYESVFRMKENVATMLRFLSLIVLFTPCPAHAEPAGGKGGLIQLVTDLNTRLEALEKQAAPPGSVMAFAGTEAPEGWEICDGDAVDGKDQKYARLFKVIGKTYGDGGSPTNKMFNLPDYRGYFLRGADHADAKGALAKRDPDVKARRPNRQDGSENNSVGSVQPMEIQKHGHDLFMMVNNDPNESFGNAWAFPNRDDTVQPGGASIGVHDRAPPKATKGSIVIKEAGGSETRPINVYVHYIIRL